MEKCCRAGQSADDGIIWHVHFACWVTKAIKTHSVEDLLFFCGNSGYVHFSVILKLTVMFISTRMYVEEMSYLRDMPSCNVHPQNTYMSVCHSVSVHI